jgi:nucleotide-binding universal stress UspA family protein
MYRRILLVSDGTGESLTALREGALIARAFQAQAYVLMIDLQTVGEVMAASTYPVLQDSTYLSDLLKLGLSRLRRLDVVASGEVARGEATRLICETQRNFKADLVVMGYRRTGILERWWSGNPGALLADALECGVLLVREKITDEELDEYLLGQRGIRWQPRGCK